MAKHRVILDCDPGQDDAISLLLAFASPDEIEILGITTVAGNVPLEMTKRNACIIRELAGREDIPVYAGCDKPLDRELKTAHMVHGPNGLDGMELFTPAKGPEEQHAVDYIIETLMQAEDESIALVPTGPFTNIAMAIQKQPKILPKIKEIVLMGGARSQGGNYTPSAEFNVYVDPTAAGIVFTCGRPITAFGLDVTYQVLCSPDRLEQLGGKKNRITEAVVGMLSFFSRFDIEKFGHAGAPLHDPCTIAYLIKPDLFPMKHCNVSVETESELTIGHTAVDIWDITGKQKNTNWALGVDADGFFDLLTERINRLVPQPRG